MALAARDKEERSALDQTLAKLFIAVHHNWSRLGDLANDIQDDEQLFDHLAERREQRRMVRENQRPGALVETLVKQGLEDEGFTVRPDAPAPSTVQPPQLRLNRTGHDERGAGQSAQSNCDRTQIAVTLATHTVAG